MFEKTRLVFEKIKEIPVIRQFTLIGGTALSIHLNHRLSEDLDFACDKEKLNKSDIQMILDVLKDQGSTITYANKISDIHDAENEGFDLDAYHQNWIVDGVKVSFFKFGSNQNERNLLSDTVSDGFIRISKIDPIFTMKCIALIERVASRDIYDIHYMISHCPGYSIDDVFARVHEYRPHIPYEHIRYRLLDWPIPASDPGLHGLTELNIDQVRESLRNMIDSMESNQVMDIAIRAINDKGHNNGFIR